MGTKPDPYAFKLCRQRIGGGRTWRYCDLRPKSWCYDCGFWVCSMHQNTRHFDHDTQGRLAP